MNTVRFGCTSLIGRNLTGNLPCDENGYYELVVGGLDVYNSANQFYTYEGARHLFESSSSLMRRVKRGVLRAEYGHPKQNGMRDSDFINRILQIHEPMVCGHHMELWLDFERIKDDQGRPVIAIMSKFRPGGPYGDVLEKQLRNKNENVCFSVRSFTDDVPTRSGVIHRNIRQLITFDYVNEPGIIHAEKYRSPGLEDFAEPAFHRDDFVTALHAQERITEEVALESGTISLEELFQAMNWSTDRRTLREINRQMAPAWTRL